MFTVLLNNGDIVVGDRNAHKPRLHPMQLCYFMVFLLGFSAPWSLSQAYFKTHTSKSVTVVHSKITIICKGILKMILWTVLLTVISGLVYSNTIAHPYLLADNRHYTFYAWKLLSGANKSIYFRYLPVPLYAYGLYFVNNNLTRSVAYKLAFWIVTPLVLCPQFLLEPRYFVVPYLMYRLHSNMTCTNDNYTLKAALAEFVAYQIVNIVVMWIFLYRPFTSTMDDTGRLDRFTW